MNIEELIKQVRRIQAKPDSGALAQVKELTRVYLGERNSFYKQFNDINVHAVGHGSNAFTFENTVQGLLDYLENDLVGGISLKRQAELNVVSDFLEQAQTLLEKSDVHPAAPAVICGAALEEFLRNWIENAEISLGGKKPGIESYANALREKELLTKQDIKDIRSWAGLRNHAAHGEWEKVSDSEIIKLMLQGINYFLRRYSE